MRRVERRFAEAIVLFALAWIAGCSGSESDRSRADLDGQEQWVRADLSEVAWTQIRAKVLEGARRDFRFTVRLPRTFERCFLLRFRRSLTRRRVTHLAVLEGIEGLRARHAKG